MKKRLIIEAKEVTDKWRNLHIWIGDNLVCIYNHEDYIHVCFGRNQPDKLRLDGKTWELKKG